MSAINGNRIDPAVAAGIKTGATITHYHSNGHSAAHLDDDEWLELYPAGNLHELIAVSKIPAEHRMHEGVPASTCGAPGQRPLLVRKSYWKGVLANAS